MHVTLDPVPLYELSQISTNVDTSEQIRERVDHARLLQTVRYRTVRGVTANAHISGRWLDAHSPISADARRLLQSAATALQLSARAYHRVLKVARTIADLGGNPEIGSEQVAEALRYRPGGSGR